MPVKKLLDISFLTTLIIFPNYITPVKCAMLSLTIFKKLFYALLSIWVMIFMSVPTVARRLSSLIPALPDSAPNAVLKLPSGALLLFLLWLSNLSIVTLFSLFLKSLGGSF